MAEEAKDKDPGAAPSGGAGDGGGTPPPAVTPEAGAGAGTAEEAWRAERDQLMQDVRDLKARVDQGAGAGGATPTTSHATDRAELDEKMRGTQQRLAEAKRLAASGDPLAGALVDVLEATAVDLRRMSARLEIADYMNELPETDRKPFKAFLDRNGNRFITLNDAYDAFDANRLRGQRDATKEARERVAAAERDRADGRVGANPRGVPAAEHRDRTMSEADFDATVARMRAAGDFDGARDMGRKLNKGEIVITK